MENAIKHHKFDTLYLWDLCMALILQRIVPSATIQSVEHMLSGKAVSHATYSE